MELEKSREPLYWERFICEDECLRNELAASVGDADIIICNSVYVSKLVFSSFKNRNIVFRSLDAVYYEACKYFENTPLSDGEKIEDRRLMESVFFELEKEALEKSSFILTLTEGDEDNFQKQYNVNPEKMVRMPICVKDSQRYDDYIPNKKINPDGKLHCVIISNRQFGTIMLLSKIISFAERIPNISFHIIGGCCGAVSETNLPDNYFEYGTVSESEKKQIVGIADCALSVPHQKNGMNTKNFDYILNGLTLLADKEGVRGLNMSENIHYFPVAFDTLEDDLKSFAETDYSRRRQIALNAYSHTISELRYENYIPRLEELTGLASRIDCCVWGAGFAGRDCYIGIQNKYNCIGFIDNDKKKQGGEFLGQTVFAFESVVNMALELGVTIIIALNNIKFISEIYRQISSALPSNEVMLYYRGVLYENNISFNKVLELRNLG